MRRLPGIHVVDVPQAVGESLPPMDVPVFVGFAQRGPLHRPVSLRDTAHYARVFGGSLDLVTAEDGSICRAHLSAAVAAFFAGGGQRCYVIRVASQVEGKRPVSSRIRVPGVAVATRRSSGAPWVISGTVLRLRASTPGAWFDGTQLSARLRSVSLRAVDNVHAGDVLRISGVGGAASGLLRVRQPWTAEAAIGSELEKGGVLWNGGTLPSNEVSRIERLTVDLTVKQRPIGVAERAVRVQLDDCGLSPGGNRPLPWFEPDVDERWDLGLGLPESNWPCAGMPPGEVATADGPLSELDAEWMIVPQDLEPTSDTWTTAEGENTDPLVRNGLAEFDAEMFLDPAHYNDLRGEALVSWAEQLRYLGPRTRALRGVHAALGYHDNPVREATWLAVPDAVHVGWRVEETPPSGRGQLEMQSDPVCGCPSKTFDVCAPPPVRPAAPVLSLPSEVPASVDWPLVLSATRLPPVLGWRVRVEVQIAKSADFTDQRPLPLDVAYGETPPSAENTMPEWALELPGTATLNVPAGSYFVRGRTWRAPVARNSAGIEEVGPSLVSEWSTVVAFTARRAKRVLLPSPKPTADSVVYQVHTALIDMVSAVRDRFALFSMPEDWTEVDVADHVKLLRSRVNRDDSARALSFAALHHPWLQQLDADGQVLGHPPEGAVLAQYAVRTRSRGCWAAAGLEPLVNTHGLSRSVDAGQLEAMGCNPLEVRVRGVSATAAFTLDLDRDWSAIGVRRLFILLRKLVGREGERFAFEANDVSLRRKLEHSFDEVLRRLLQAGGLRGRGADEAYRLRTAAGGDLSREIERGQCSLEIQVAPSRPLRFLTLYAVRSADRLQIEERS